jgi:uncharacterized protein
MKSFATALLAGALFGSGLLLSGMADPQNVLGFLDIAGAWNPALAFTMAGAILVAAPAYHWVRRHGRTVGREPLDITPRAPVDVPLLAGAAVFGIGWGMSGICPGPALILLAGAASAAPVFVASMVAGMLLVRALR